jgi:2-methylisocitrate lyase-like PEP mutase family enzyme
MSSQIECVLAFRALHAPGHILVLPNAWDAASARLAEDCGAAAIATSSASLAWCHGYADGQAIPRETMLAAVKEIVRVVHLPVSVDSEAGFSDDPGEVADWVAALVKEGAAGINLEDGKSPPELLAAKIAAIKQRLKAMNADVFINARTDVFLHKLVVPEAAMAEAITRGLRYARAGADGNFVPAMTDPAQIREVASAVALPLNALTSKGLPPVSELKTAGVRRVSSGAGPARAAYGAMQRATKRLLNDGQYDEMFGSAVDCPNFNALMSR